MMRYLAAAARNCTTCPLLGKPERVRAIYVARNASGLEWFECEGHSADDHPCGPRTRLETLAGWFGRHGLPVPSERARGPQ